jgi:hypothetical protein
MTILKPPTCDCIVVTGYKKGSRTPERWPGFCPLHEAADDLLVALVQLMEGVNALGVKGAPSVLLTQVSNARVAIAKARGTK